MIRWVKLRVGEKEVVLNILFEFLDLGMFGGNLYCIFRININM